MRVTRLPCIVKMHPAVELPRGVNSLIGSYLVKLKKNFILAQVSKRNKYFSIDAAISASVGFFYAGYPAYPSSFFTVTPVS